MQSQPPTDTSAHIYGREETLEASKSAVSWAAILAGAAAATAVSVLLLTLGSGLGLTSISPWPNSGATATTFAISAAVFLILVQWIASGLGGYLTGRLRTKWTATHTDEVFFRDTAHGFLAWAIATVVTVTIVASAAGSLASGGARAVANVASGAAQGASQGAGQSGSSFTPSGYLIDDLFRSDHVDPTATSLADSKAEATRIVATSVQNGSLSAADRTYLAQMTAARTGISQADAEKRVDDLTAQANAAADKARATADEARKASAKFSFYLFFSMLIGAFIACVSGALGGRERDAA